MSDPTLLPLDCLADLVPWPPCQFLCDIELSCHLQARQFFLADGHEVHCLQALAHGEPGIGEDHAKSCAEAGSPFPIAVTVRLTLVGRDFVGMRTSARAVPTIRTPNPPLEPFDCEFLDQEHLVELNHAQLVLFLGRAPLRMPFGVC